MLVVQLLQCVQCVQGQKCVVGTVSQCLSLQHMNADPVQRCAASCKHTACHTSQSLQPDAPSSQGTSVRSSWHHLLWTDTVWGCMHSQARDQRSDPGTLHCARDRLDQDQGGPGSGPGRTRRSEERRVGEECRSRGSAYH